MSLGVADKLLRAFEALKNFKDGTNLSDTPNKKKESSLSKKDRINHLNTIGDLTISPLLRNLNEFGKLVAVSIETLLSFCDDEEPDVRLVAGDCINKMIKGFMDANVARIHVELYKEIKKNGSSRCLRAALSKFADISALIRPHKCRPFITNLLPCFARICTREQDLIQETLATSMKKIIPCLGSFMNDRETKILLKTFLQNVTSSSPTVRRTAATSITVICLHGRNPKMLFSWIINILLKSMSPFSLEENSATYCGVLLCFRHVFPRLDHEEDGNEVVMRGSFGVTLQSQGDENSYLRDDKQLFKMFEMIMRCTKHTDHNVVTSSLEALQQLLQSLPKRLLTRLMSEKGMTLLSNEFDNDIPGASISSTSLDDLDSLSFASSSATEEQLADISVDGPGLKDHDNTTISIDEIRELRRNLSEPTDSGVETDDTSSIISEASAESTESSDVDEGMGHRRVGSNTSGIITRSSSADDLDVEGQVQGGFTMDNEDLVEVPLDEGGSAVDEQFTIDPVVCRDAPILHCGRVMCWFLLSGRQEEVISDRKVRVSVKSLALGCLAAIMKLYPEAFFARVVPPLGGDEGEPDKQGQYGQSIKDVLLYQTHHDPQIRGTLAILLTNFLESSVRLTRFDFNSWCKAISSETDGTAVIEDILDVLGNLVMDESSVTVRLTCLGLRQCLPLLLQSSFAYQTLRLCVKLIQLKKNSYWLVKVELLQIIGGFDFSLFQFLERQPRPLSVNTQDGGYSFQEMFFNDVVLVLLVNGDQRVRTEAAQTIVKLIPSMFFENDFKKEPLLAVTKKTIGHTMAYTLSSHPGQNSNEIITIQKNLARVVTILSYKLNTDISKHTVLGCCEALALLSNMYPVPSWPSSWGCHLQPHTRSPPVVYKPAFLHTNIFSTSKQPTTQPIISSIMCNNGGGVLAFIVQLMTSSWLTLNLRAHEDALLLVSNLLVGIATSALSLSGGGGGGQSSEKAPGTSDDSNAVKWSVFGDPSISALAEKILIHVVRILKICCNVIENVSPGSNTTKVSVLSKEKEKSSTAIPGAAVPTSGGSQSPATTTTSVASPKKLLNRARKSTVTTATATEVQDSPNVENKNVKNEGEEKKTAVIGALGQYHHLLHYCKLHGVIKGAFSNYKVNLKYQDDKFIKMLKSVLKVFATLLELATFNDIGKYVEEIIGYLESTVKCEASTTFLCVQQMLRAIFGVNVANQPENSSSNFTNDKEALVTEVILSPFLEDSSQTFYNSGFYNTFFEQYQQELSKATEEFRKRDQTPERKSSFGFLKKLRERSGSFRPPLKVDKQVRIHVYIRMFEPLVIQALKEYTSSSDVQTQSQVLSILVQLIRLRVNYALLDSEQAFLNFVLKQFEFIKDGQLRETALFCPHIFQFLILLSYECFQPKANQAKAVFDMSRIIQVCNDLMASGQSATTHAIPALRPIVYDLFDPQATGRNENSRDLDTQREVFISMLLRLAQFPEILKLIVYVLNFNRKNDDKWKKISRQAVDITLQLVTKQQVLVDDAEGLKSLENLFDSVAPIALRPIDMILKVLFASASLPSSLFMRRWLCHVLVLLKVILTQNTEENLLSRISQLGFKGIIIGNIVDSEELEGSDIAAETAADKIFVYFILHALYFAIKNVTTTSSEYRLVDNSIVNYACQQTSFLLLHLQEMIKSGLFKTVSNCLSQMIKKSLLQRDCQQSHDKKVRKIHELFISIKDVQPTICVQWLQLLYICGIHDGQWWTQLHERMSEKDALLSINTHICLKGTFLLRCKLLNETLKSRNDEDNTSLHSFVEENLTDLVQLASEPPVKMLLRQIHSSTTCSRIFIDVVKTKCAKRTIQNIHELVFKKNLLVILDDLHYEQSNSLIQLLLAEFLESHHRAITRKCETMICSRLEYCISLPGAEFGSFFSPDDIRNIHDSLVSLGVTKRNPRLSSLISHVSAVSSTSQPLINTIDIANAIIAIKNKDWNDTGWYYTFVYNCCCSWKLKDIGVKNVKDVAILLHALTFEQIAKIMDDEKFNTILLKPCLVFGISMTTKYNTRKFDHQTPESPFEDTHYFDQFNVDHLFQSSFTLLLRHIQEIVFSVTDLAENGEESPTTDAVLLKSTMNFDRVSELCNDHSWLEKLLHVTQSVEAYLALTEQLECEAGQIPSSIYCAVCQFGMVSLQALCEESGRSNSYCTSKLTIVLKCFARMLHNRALNIVFNSPEYIHWVSHSLRTICHLVKAVFIHPGHDQLDSSVPEEPHTNQTTTDIPLKQASCLVNYLYTILDSSQSNIPYTLTQAFRDVIIGLARLSVFNSYVRIPPLVWKMGWLGHDNDPSPLATEILREKDVLQDFVLRVHSIGWISRQQFEETWAALLGVLSSPLLPDESSREEDIESMKSGCLALQCITALLLQTTLYPLPGNPAMGVNTHIPRQKDLPFLGSRAGQKLCAVRSIVECYFLSQSPKKQSLHVSTVDDYNLYGGNIENVPGIHIYSQGQLSIASLQAQCAVPMNEGDTEVNQSSPIANNDKIDVRSCVQLLMELFEQWISPYTQPKTPLMLLTQAVKSLFIISDLFLDQAQFECLLSELLDLYQNHPPEDEIIMQYLLPALCKAVAVLKMESVIPEKIVKIMETSFRAPHVPLQISALHGAMYLLECHLPSIVSLVIPLLTDYTQKILSFATDTSVFGENRLLVLLSTSFYLLEHYDSEITDGEFKKTFLSIVIKMVSSKDESTPLNIYHAVIRGLERLVVSFSLTREESNLLVKLSVDRLAMRNPQRAISALGLLLTCMYTGKEGDRPSGLSPTNDVTDAPTDDVLLVALERVTSLFDRIRKGFRSEAKLVSEILPIVLSDFFPPQDVMNKVIGEFLSSQQPHPELMAEVLYKVCENLITRGQQESVKDWVLLSLRSLSQRPPLGMAVWSFTCTFISTSSNKFIRALFPHVVSRIGKLESIDRNYFLISAVDFFFNQNLTEDEKQSFKSTFEKVAQTATPYGELVVKVS